MAQKLDEFRVRGHAHGALPVKPHRELQEETLYALRDQPTRHGGHESSRSGKTPRGVLVDVGMPRGHDRQAELASKPPSEQSEVSHRRDMHDIGSEFFKPRAQELPVAQDARILPQVLLHAHGEASAPKFDMLHRALPPALVFRARPHAHERNVIADGVVRKLACRPGNAVHFVVGVRQVGDSRPPRNSGGNWHLHQFPRLRHRPLQSRHHVPIAQQAKHSCHDR